MEERNRRIWTIVVVAAVLGVLCCSLAVVGAAIASWLASYPDGTIWGSGVEGGEIDRTYDVGRSPELLVDSFAGAITVRAGEGSEIQVLATRRAPRRSDLERIEVEIEAREGRLAIMTSNPDRLSRAWVRLDLVVPVNTSFDLRTSSGNVTISGLDGGGKAETSSGGVTARELSGSVALHTSSGDMSVVGFDGSLSVHVSSGTIEIDEFEGNLAAHTSSGQIDVRGADGPVHLSTSSGSIDYQGSPVGDCRFETGSGSIDLRLPSGLDAWVDLRAGAGSIKVDFPVEGESTRRRVQGTIGRGDDASISAETSSGSIRLRHD